MVGRLLGVETSPFTVLGLLVAVLIVILGTLLSPLVLSAAEPEPNLIYDCDVCPKLVVIPAGSFLMGSPEDERDRNDNEDDQEGHGGAQVLVTIEQPFAAGRTEVTWAEWQACVDEGGCEGAGPEEAGGAMDWGKGNRPVINVSWDDAKTYVAWLSQKTGHAYRLLSEAEWEYAARAGTTTRFWFGDDITAREASFASSCSGVPATKACAPDSAGTRVVGSYPPSGFGFYDIYGNVWEWVEDCYVPSYADTSRDGSAYAPESCARRVLRGGSWFNKPKFLRSAGRGANEPHSRFKVIGFRISRTLN
jgi:formylglycine-generating enzyme required for sulfatase activity